MVLRILTKILNIDISFNELQRKAEEIEYIADQLKELESLSKKGEERKDIDYIG